MAFWMYIPKPQRLLPLDHFTIKLIVSDLKITTLNTQLACLGLSVCLKDEQQRRSKSVRESLKKKKQTVFAEGKKTTQRLGWHAMNCSVDSNLVASTALLW